MSGKHIQGPTVEEHFVFGSPPFINNTTYNSCRGQEGFRINGQPSANICSQSEEYWYEDSFASIQTENHFGEENVHDKQSNNSDNTLDLNQDAMASVKTNGYRHDQLKGGYFNGHNGKFFYKNGGVHPPFHKNGFKSHHDLAGQFQSMNMNGSRTNHLENGLKYLEQAGLKVQQLYNEPVFRKRKDLRTLKAVLSSERFREVVLKFGDGGDDGGKEILDSVHRSMKGANMATTSCVFCSGQSQVYENFPIVDGTLFLSPVKLSSECVDFSESSPRTRERYMCFICVNCLEGKPNPLRCSSCGAPWNGSFFQIGTLYSYNILSAIPCCQRSVSCKNCTKPIVDIANGEASTLYFSHFSTKVTCPHCQTSDFHFVKPLSSLSGVMRKEHE